MEPLRLLFVCLGNICRSPAAEGVARVLTKKRNLKLKLDSAGTGAWHAGEPPHTLMQQVAAQRGYPIDDLRARQVEYQDFMEFDWIIAMDPSNLRNLQDMAKSLRVPSRARLRLLLNKAIHGTDGVPDPYYGGLEGFEQCLDLVEAGVEHLLLNLASD